MRDDPNETQFTERDITFLKKLCKNEQAKLQRRIAKSNFVPEPGRIDMNKAKIERISLIVQKLDRLWDDVQSQPYLDDDVMLWIGIGTGDTGQYVGLCGDDETIVIVDNNHAQRIDLVLPEAAHTHLGKLIERVRSRT